MELRLVNPADWIDAIRALLADNWAETGFDFELAPDVARYGALHDAGALFALAALDGDEVVGYCTAVVGASYSCKTLFHDRGSGRLVRGQTPCVALLGAGVHATQPNEAAREPAVLPAP